MGSNSNITAVITGETIKIEDRPIPTPVGNNVLINVLSTACNRADLLQLAGLYPAPPGSPDDVLGLEFYGVVVDVGEGVINLTPGDRVCGLIGGGAQAQYITVPEFLCVSLPRNYDDVNLGAFPEAFFTAYEVLYNIQPIRPGARIFVNAIGSGVATAVIQLANLLGASVYGTTRTKEKLDQAVKIGLAGGLVLPDNFNIEDTSGALIETAGAPFDFGVDLLGGDYMSLITHSLRKNGHAVSLGFISHHSASISLGQIISKRLTIHGTSLRGRPDPMKGLLASQIQDNLISHLIEGRIQPIVDSVFSIKDINSAYHKMSSNQSFGKILINLASD